jgi:hypothetical protein
VFAQWLTSSENPIVARVLVNRIWQRHFGAGLVPTVENLGLSGARPSHPELLDYLATELVKSGWSMKAIHRLIVNSATYRQSSTLRKDAYSIDPDNRLLWRYRLQRLDAESIRDAMLSVSGELDPEFGGPYIPTKADAEGQVTVDEGNPRSKRRSLYLQQRRTQPLAVLDVFDGAQMNPNCTRRNPSTVSLQSLSLLNSEFMRARSRAFAKRLLTEEKLEVENRLARAFQLAWTRSPRSNELADARDFLQAQIATYGDKSESEARARAWTDFCQMLMASNAFLYVE